MVESITEILDDNTRDRSIPASEKYSQIEELFVCSFEDCEVIKESESNISHYNARHLQENGKRYPCPFFFFFLYSQKTGLRNHFSKIHKTAYAKYLTNQAT